MKLEQVGGDGGDDNYSDNYKSQITYNSNGDFSQPMVMLQT